MIARLISLIGFSLMLTSNAPSSEWPDLPTTGFISGRAATVEDVGAGNAAFSMQGAGVPLSIDIPQYVLWKDEDGKQHPMILIQAEKAPDGTKIVGLRAVDGSDTVATLPEITLLGTKKPAS